MTVNCSINIQMGVMNINRKVKVDFLNFFWNSNFWYTYMHC